MYLQANISKQCIVHTLEYINKCLSINSEEEFSQHVLSLTDIIPHQYAMCGLGKINGHIIHIKNIINVNFPEQWLNLYFKNNLFKYDPIVLNHSSPNAMIWSQVASTLNDEKSKLVFDHAQAFGLFEGVSYGIEDHKTKISSIFSLSGFSEKIPGHHIALFETIVPHLHQALFKLNQDDADIQDSHNKIVKSSILSHREKEILNWIMVGKSNWEISIILNISERTVKFHVSNILKKLDTVSRTHAVAIALNIGLITL